MLRLILLRWTERKRLDWTSWAKFAGPDIKNAADEKEEVDLSA